MVADGATAHRLEAEKIKLIKLPAYAPELNPVERFFEQLRSELKFCVFETLDEAEEHLTKVLEKYFKQPELVKSLTLYPYIKYAHLNLNYYYFTGKEEYAAKATNILLMWFLDAKTKMNPNLEFAQAIPGLNNGGGIGIIETRVLTNIVDTVGLLENSKYWTKEDQNGLENWFSKYLDWLLTSKNGRDEEATKNNHGTYYDMQTALFALFTGKKDLAKSILETAEKRRITVQIAPDGSQPLELERTKSWDYSVMNLDGMISLAILGKSVDVDLWKFETADKRGIRRALEFLYQFSGNEKNWKHKQIEPLKIKKLYPLMQRASIVYKDENL